MTNDPVNLDKHRDSNSRKSTEVRRQLIEVKADQDALKDRQEEFESFLLEVPAHTLPEAAARIQALMQVTAAMLEARNPCCQLLIADAPDALGKLSDHAKEH